MINRIFNFIIDYLPLFFFGLLFMVFITVLVLGINKTSKEEKTEKIAIEEKSDRYSIAEQAFAYSMAWYSADHSVQCYN